MVARHMCYPSRTPSAQLPTKSEFRTSKVRPIQIYMCKDNKTINDSLLFIAEGALTAGEITGIFFYNYKY